MSNILQHETSLYLKQHAEQPVHWQLWSDETLAEAKSADRPIFCLLATRVPLVPGDVARILQRPDDSPRIERAFLLHQGRSRGTTDLDKVYLSAMQLLTQHGGGWPLNLFLTRKPCCRFSRVPISP